MTQIILTGASSFTGYWFAKALCEAGFNVLTLFQKEKESYEGIRKKRVLSLESFTTPFFNTSFGTPAFFEIFKKQGKVDIFCHHAADVRNYKSKDFDPIYALNNNGGNLKTILSSLKEEGCEKVLLTGSVFEQREGFGNENLRAVSPYGLSKGLTSDLFLFYCDILGISLGKFVIPNPFGPLEDFKFTSFLAKTWLEGKKAPITMPEYVRDNIHVELLAKSYAQFALKLQSFSKTTFLQTNPSGYVESQGAFVHRFSEEMKKRLSCACEFDILPQTDFSEPKVRINKEPLSPKELFFKESEAFDLLADFYLKTYS